jgi:parallel beta-helix repeat protein
MQKSRVLSAVFALAATPAAFATTINVPADYSTIQAAINAAVNGDVIVVAVGVFKENIDFKGKEITVQGAGRRPPGNTPFTMVDGSNGGPTCTMATGETAASILMDIELRFGTGKLINGKRYGGGLYISKLASPTLDNVGIGSNTADLGAGVFVDKNCNPTFIDCLIANNVTKNKGQGGGVYVLGTATFDFCRIAENTATYGTGGGIYLRDSKSVITNSEFDKNHSWYGGGLHIHGGTPTVDATLFEENEVITAPINGEGGGMGITGKGSPLVTNSEFRFNFAHTGAGIYTYDATPLVGANLIHDNTSSTTSSGFGFGGGMALGKTGGQFELNEIYYNIATLGGGISTRSSTTALLLNNVIDHNDADPAGIGVGGGIFSKDSTPTVLGNTIADNAANDGGGLFVTGIAAPAVDTSIIWGNTANANVSFFDGSGFLTFGFSDVEAASLGGSSLSIDPLFADSANRDYRLGSGSPVVDAGNFTFSGPATDIYGNPRIVNGRVDMGAAEQ